jgi:hypothetical protein
MAARFLIGAAGTLNPLLRPGWNVNFALPGMGFDIPKIRGTGLAPPFNGLMFPARRTYNPTLDIRATSLSGQ